jgi:hypothetical protein
MLSVTQLEKRIIWISLAFAPVLLGLSALAINLFHVGLPTCLTDIKPFQKGELITHSPTHRTALRRANVEIRARGRHCAGRINSGHLPERCGRNTRFDFAGH